MAQNDGILNLNRAICVAAGEAEKADQQPLALSKDEALMYGIYLNDYVKVGTL